MVLRTLAICRRKVNLQKMKHPGRKTKCGFFT